MSEHGELFYSDIEEDSYTRGLVETLTFAEAARRAEDGISDEFDTLHLFATFEATEGETSSSLDCPHIVQVHIARWVMQICMMHWVSLHLSQVAPPSHS